MIDLYNKDCFEVFKELPDNSIDLVLTDPPYGTTSIKWDNVLDFEKMWVELERIVKPKGNIILFGSQPFTSKLINSKIDWFKYELIWNKNKCGSPGLAKIRPNKVHENIMLFSKESGGTYNPIMEKGNPYERFNPEGYGSGKNTHNYGFGNKKSTGSKNDGTRYPKSILHSSRNFSAQQTLPPTQKPTSLLNWLIMTYSNIEDIVLDFTMGSGSTGVSSKLTGRKFIGVELEQKYYEIAKKRINNISDNTFEPLVTEQQHQLTTQLPENIKTKPDTQHEDFSKIIQKS